jgi:hypothetical protein
MYTPSLWKKYNYAWITLILFAGSLVGHWTFAWYAFVHEQVAHNEVVDSKEYFIEVARDTFENWQSEFLQLLWQVGGLAFLFYVGSPQSKEGNDRKEEKIDEILKALYGEKARTIINELDTKYPRKK